MGAPWSIPASAETFPMNPPLLLAAAESVPPVDYLSLVFVFLLSTFVGLQVIARVSRLLHTPLMSLTNAISAIAVVGAILVAGRDYEGWINLLGLAAITASVINIVSGFLITDRMLKMFKQRDGNGAASGNGRKGGAA